MPPHALAISLPNKFIGVQGDNEFDQECSIIKSVVVKRVGEQHMLSEEEVAQYHRDGWIVPNYRVPDDLLRDAQDLTTRMLAERPDYADLYPDLLRAEPRFCAIGIDPKLLSILAQLMGDDIVLWTGSVFGKPAGQGKATPWHQDGEYWPIQPLETLTAWVALDHSTPENGCLRVVEGSHQPRKLFSHHRNDADDITLNQEVDAEGMNAGTIKDIILEPGQVSIHDVYLVHGSNANTSAARRAGLTYRYMPAASHFDRTRAQTLHDELGVTNLTDREIYLVHGHEADNGNTFTELPSA